MFGGLLETGLGALVWPGRHAFFSLWSRAARLLLAQWPGVNLNHFSFSDSIQNQFKLPKFISIQILAQKS
jgi:hypothetical protein